METNNLYKGRKGGENEFSEKGTDLKPRPYVSNVSVAFVVIDHQIDNGGYPSQWKRRWPKTRESCAQSDLMPDAIVNIRVSSCM
ncbi:hypothetical protein CY34DRAFT_799478 [Suillus luteus UH-Slu-Lm8-n1]|uniref:Uncharacterized protein n=1 Tax=Suillus luteus UH-Slu-Lm8-n1 TaxID=930992 RepID=A0A0D0BC21_9AGAM|nr:hypothetical protein CY34DRAFT_799478 [Suillus luteus UH-Slu-Lm8-n1]